MVLAADIGSEEVESIARGRGLTGNTEYRSRVVVDLELDGHRRVRALPNFQGLLIPRSPLSDLELGPSWARRRDKELEYLAHSEAIVTRYPSRQDDCVGVLHLDRQLYLRRLCRVDQFPSTIDLNILVPD